jgi:hypothetical protein
MYGDGAEMAAAMYADKALAKNDLKASVEWRHIVFAIQQIAHEPRPAREAMN